MMKKDSFLKGTLIASIAIIITKVLGILYVIPFYDIIGTSGGVLYAYAYSIYNLFLNISTAGIPIAISMIVSEYITLGMFDAKERVYKISKKMVLIISVLAFLILFLFSYYVSIFFVGGISGSTPKKDIDLAVKAISLSLLIAPILSVYRGYIQGHKYISPTSISQVIEQFIRIIFLLVTSYLCIKIFKTSVTIGVVASLLGAFVGAIIAYIYLQVKKSKNKDKFEVKEDKKDNITNKEITKKIIYFCIPLIIISVTNDLYNIIDMKLIIKGLYMIGYPAKDAELISSIIATWAPKICMLIMAISMGLTTSLTPHIIEKYTKKDYKGSNQMFNKAISTMLFASLPMTIGIIIFKDEIYNIFYGASAYGGNILAISAVVTLVIGILTVANTSLQGFKKFKTVIISTLTGLVINTILDIPLILLFHKLGLIEYFGTSTATIIGALISLCIVMIYLKKKYKFSYISIFNNFIKISLSSIVMALVIINLNYFINVNPTSKIFITLKVFIYGIIGLITYLVTLYLNNGFKTIFDIDIVRFIKSKLKKAK